jgi:flagellar biosynthesis/type III secretory pathway M-ring protein FliF/YscJ
MKVIIIITIIIVIGIMIILLMMNTSILYRALHGCPNKEHRRIRHRFGQKRIKYRNFSLSSIILQSESSFQFIY